MFEVDLRDLERAGSLRIQRRILEDDPFWADTGLTPGGAVEVDLTAAITATGQVVVRGRLNAPLLYGCRRCLARVDRPVRQDVELVWAAPGELSDESYEGGELRSLAAGASAIDLGEALREELILDAPRYVVCKEECLGLCARCGADLNEGACGCVTDESDPRWDALRALGNE